MAKKDPYKDVCNEIDEFIRDRTKFKKYLYNSIEKGEEGEFMRLIYVLMNTRKEIRRNELMFKTLLFIFIGLILGMLSVLVFASAQSQEIPRIEPYVNDFADLLSDDEELQLNLLLDSIEQNTSVEIAVVTVQTTFGEDRIIYANKIGDENGVGKKDLSNGVVILYSMENEHGGAIAVGRGIESMLNDAKVARIGREHKPLFDEGKYYEGFENMILDIREEIGEEYYYGIANSSGTPKDSGNNEDSLFWFLLIPITIMFFYFVFKFLDSSDNHYYDSNYEPQPLQPRRKRGRPRKRKRKDDEEDDDDISSSLIVSGSSSSSSPSFGGFSGGGFGGAGGRF